MNRGFQIVSKYNNTTAKDLMDRFQMPRRGTKTSAGYDVFNNTGNSITIEPGNESPAISTYLKAYMLDDEMLTGHVRSNHGFKFSLLLANGTAIIDSDYYNNEKNEGEIFVKFRNHGNKTVIIAPGEGMAQFIFQKYLLTDNDEVTVGGNRTGGLGSTNK